METEAQGEGLTQADGTYGAGPGLERNPGIPPPASTHGRTCSPGRVEGDSPSKPGAQRHRKPAAWRKLKAPGKVAWTPP